MCQENRMIISPTPFPRLFLSRRNVLKSVLGCGILFCGRNLFPTELDEINDVANVSDMINQSADALASCQNEDGSFGTKSELFGGDPAVAALCGMAFLALGSLPNRGRYGKELTKIVDYLLSRTFKTRGKTASAALKTFDLPEQNVIHNYLRDNDLSHEDVDGVIANFSEKGFQPLYGHGFATLFLAEIFGVVSRPEIRDTLQSAVNLLVRTQNSEGGWRYEPKRASIADISVTTCQLSALRSVRNAGIAVPEETIRTAKEFILRLQNQDGGFRYTKIDGPSGYGRTAAAVHALQSIGSEISVPIERAFSYLERVYPVTKGDISSKEKIEYWAYSQFYAALSYWRASINDTMRERNLLFFQRVTKEALKQRGADGLWRSSVSSEAETAFIICALSVPQERFPFFLR